ncbi:hypothetical protein [Myxococcus sp. CA040A]|uniref:hypothetical protein n=1 Tax=Myxococcus sp. CA040A TaxID=2741738 RepID=UPI00157AA41D|nr:hypothetical protein [Myxococcus sp. CA040A]NTX05898.1 hypothetical protein [Myxococcus sp. CA040A]
MRTGRRPLEGVAREEGSAMGVKTVRFDFENTRDTSVDVWFEPSGMPFKIPPGGRLDVICEGPEGGELEVERHPEGHVTLYAWWGAWFRVVEEGRVVYTEEGMRAPPLPRGVSMKQMVETLFGPLENRQAMLDKPKE